MAEIRQGYLDDYTQITSGNIGIGTSVSNEKLEIIGGVTSQELNVTGIATFTHVSGFIKKHTDYAENVNITAGDSGTLSGEIVVGAGLTMSVGTSATTSQGSVDSLKVSNMFQPPSGGTNQRPPGKPGAIFYNFDFKTIEFFDGNSWRQVDNVTRTGRGVISGGRDSNLQMQFINIASQGNSQNFGLHTGSTSTFEGFGVSSSTRGLFAGTYPGQEDIIEYITIASEGDSIDFGNLTDGRRSGGSVSSSTRGLFAAGISPADVNIIDYVEIATLGNALDFGDTSTINSELTGLNNSVRGFLCGGTPNPSGAFLDVIEVVTMASKGDAVEFGNLNRQVGTAAGASNSVRGLVMGGAGWAVYVNLIDAVTLASGGNAVNFGNLTTARGYNAGVASQTRACCLGGLTPSPAGVNIIDFVQFTTTGNASDFGDLNKAVFVVHGISDSHGGLGGF